jgi:hypothetical protein
MGDPRKGEVTDHYTARAITRFVRDTLGCSCPTEVFSRLELDPNVHVAGIDYPFTRIVIGERLLVLVVTSGDGEALRQGLPALISYGRAERDRMGYNRFRLVVAVTDSGELEPMADGVLGEMDDRVHLHVVGRWELPVLSGG